MCQVEFPYHPNIYQLEFSPIKPNQEARFCQVCGCVPELYLDRMYSTETIHRLCLQCVASGAAADQFDGAYIQDAEWQKVSDPALVKNFFVRHQDIVAGKENIGQPAAMIFVISLTMWEQQN